MSEEKELTPWQKYKKNLGVSKLEPKIEPKLEPSEIKSPENVYEGIQKNRMEICLNCVNYISTTDQCKKCGCVMAIKSNLLLEKCPIQKWERPRNLIIIPSRDRVSNVERAISAIKETAVMSDIVIGLDDDNESIYPRIDGAVYEVNERLRMNGTLNLLAIKYVSNYQTITFMGDDHLPRTYGWDAKLYSFIEKRGYGVAYGNDLLAKKDLPTAVMMSSNIISTLGFMSPPEQIHMFLDNFWKAVGERLEAIAYFEDVIIEHMHAYVGKSELDEMYLSVNNPEVGSHDGKKYGEYINTKFENDVAKLKKALQYAEIV